MKKVEEKVLEEKEKTAEEVENNKTNKEGKSVVKEEKRSEPKKTNSKKESKVEEIKENKDAQSKEPKSDVENTEKTDMVSKESNVTDMLISDKPKGKYNKIIIISVIICVLLFILLFSTIFALTNLNNKTIISGVSIKGVDVSGLTKEEAINKMNSIIDEKLTSEFNLVLGDSVTAVVPEQFDAKFDIESSIDTAYGIGRNSNIFKNNYEILSSSLFKMNISPIFSYNEEVINTLASEIDSNLPNRLIEPSYYIEGDNLIVTKGVDGVTIDSNSLKLKIISNINNFYNKNEDIEIPVINATAKDLDIDAIHSEIYKEPKDAYFTTEPFAIYPHVIGVDFAISMDEAKQLLQEDKESYTIPLKFTTPEITTNEIGTEAFPDLLADYSTTYSTRNVNRSTNISLASAKINGTVVMPDETFSYNTTVGQRTASAGFKTAAVYSGGEVTTGIGGGICQVSSTLYNSVLLSNLEIVERQNHGFNPGYVPAGRDATVSWGGPDFKFKNTRSYPIKIACSGTGGTINVKIFGLKEENEYDVEIQSYITSYIQYKTIERQDPTLPAGQTKVIESGSNGCRSVCYRILKQNGEIISKDLLSQDTYSPHNRIVATGTQVTPAQNKTATPTKQVTESVTITP